MEKRGCKVEVIIIIEVGKGIDLVLVVVIDIEFQIIGKDLSTDKTIEKGLNMLRIIEEVSLGEDTIESTKL